MENALFWAILFLGIVSILAMTAFILYIGGNLYIKYSDKNKKIEIRATNSDSETHS